MAGLFARARLRRRWPAQRPLRLRWLPGKAATQTYSYTATGGLAFGGTSTRAKIDAVVASGGLNLSGASTASKVKVAVSIGGLTFTGAALPLRAVAYSSIGGLNLSGASTQVRKMAYSSLGGLNLSGAATVSFHVSSYSYTATGGISLAGVAGYSNFTFGTEVAGRSYIPFEFAQHLDRLKYEDQVALEAAAHTEASTNRVWARYQYYYPGLRLKVRVREVPV